MLVTWTTQHQWDFPKDELLQCARERVRKEPPHKLIDDMWLATEAVKDYLPCMDDDAYYAVTDDCYIQAYNLFYCECSEELKAIIEEEGHEVAWF